MSTTVAATTVGGILAAQAESSPPPVDSHSQRLRDDFYSRIKSRLFWRIGRELRTAGRVLDLGCGQCDLARYLNKIYRQRVTGVDLSSKSFPLPGNLSAGVPIRCVCGDAQRLHLLVCASSKDAVVMTWTLHQMKPVIPVLRQAYRALRPGGMILIVDVPCLNDVGEQLTQAGFGDVEVRSIENGQIVWARGFRPPQIEGNV